MLRRKTGLRRGGWLRRPTPLRPVNKERRAKRHAENFGDRAAHVRDMPCLCAGKRGEGRNPCSPPVQAAHVRSRGAGGNRRDLVPLCFQHHYEQHGRGVATFSKLYDVDLPEEARRIAAHLDDLGVA